MFGSLRTRPPSPRPVLWPPIIPPDPRLPLLGCGAPQQCGKVFYICRAMNGPGQDKGNFVPDLTVLSGREEELVRQVEEDSILQWREEVRGEEGGGGLVSCSCQLEFSIS